MPEDQIRSTLNLFPGTTSNDIRSVISLVTSEDGTIIVYDHYEGVEGYEPDIDNPVQSSTLIFGDGNPANGNASTYCSTCAGDLLMTGNVLSFENLVSTVINYGMDIRFGGRDLIASNRSLVITRAAWGDPDQGTLLAGAVEVLDTSAWGLNFETPVGETLSGIDEGMFNQTDLFIMAAQNNTMIAVDNGGVTNYVLNQGESLRIPDVILGATVTSDLPIQVHMTAGDLTASYEVRWFTMYPLELWDDSYYNPVGPTSSDDRAFVYLYNPNAFDITVNYETNSSSGNIPVNAGVTSRHIPPLGEGAHYFTNSGDRFFALTTVDSDSTSNNSTYDWGLSLVPESYLKQSVVVAWGPGLDFNATTCNPASAVNGSPVWVTTTENTTFYVDYDGDGSAPFTAPNGLPYDVSFTVDRLESTTVYDPDRDQTGMLVFTTDGTKIASAWGQDPETAGSSCPYLDMGTTIPPNLKLELFKEANIESDFDGDMLLDPGDTLLYRIVLENNSLRTRYMATLYDTLETYLQYEPNTTIRKSSNGGLSGPIPDSGITPFPLDESGYVVGDLEGKQFDTIEFKVVALFAIYAEPEAFNSVTAITIDPDTLYAEVTTPIDEEPLIGLAKDMNYTGTGPWTVTIEYVLENFGSNQVDNLIMTDDLDAVFGAGNYSITGRSSSGDQGTNFHNNLFTGNGANLELIATGQVLDPGGVETITIILNLTTLSNISSPISLLGDYENQVIVNAEGPDSYPINDTSTDGLDPDRDGDNGDGSIDDDDFPEEDDPTPMQIPFNPQIDIVKSGSLDLGPNGFANPGDMIDYTFQITNTGDVSLTDITVSDPIVGPISCPSGNPIPGLLPMESETCTGSYPITQTDIDAGVKDNTATVTATDPQGGQVNDQDDHSEPIPPDPDYTIIKTITDVGGDGAGGVVDQAGDLISYLVEIMNTGNITITNVMVSDPLVTNLTRQGDAPGNNDGNLDVGETWIYTGSYMATQGDIDNNGGGDGDIDNTVSIVSNEISTPRTDDATVPIFQNPDYAILKSVTDVDGDGAGGVVDEAGDVISYLVELANTGNQTITNVMVSDPLVTNLTRQGDAPGNNDGNLDVGETWIYSGSYSATQGDIDNNGGGDGDIDNTVTVTSTEIPTPSTDDAFVPIVQSPDISLVKDGNLNTGGDGLATPNDLINYTFTVSNTGNVTLTNVMVSDPLISPINCPMAILAPGETQVCSGAYPINQMDIDAGIRENTATVIASPLIGPDVSDMDDHSEPIPQFPSISLIKDGNLDSGPDGIANPGDLIEYSFTITNTGNVTLTNVNLTDPVVMNLSCPLSTLAPAESQICTADYSLTQADIDIGFKDNTASVSGTPPFGPDVNDNDNHHEPIPQNPKIGISKKFQNLEYEGNNRFSTEVVIHLLNVGNVTLGDIQLIENLTDEFGTYIVGTPDSYDQYTIQNLQIEDNSVDALYLNSGFNGASIQELMNVMSGGSMPPGEYVSITFDLIFVPVRNYYLNQIFVMADLPIEDDPTGLPDDDAPNTTDDSDSGLNATDDASQGGDNPGEPGDTGSTEDPTPLIIPEQIGDKVWKDLDGDGIQDINEPGIPGIVVRLYNCANNFQQIDLTDQDGNYLFQNLNPGNYKLQFDISNQPKTCKFTFANEGLDDEIDSDVDQSGWTDCFQISAGEYDNSKDAGLLVLGAIADKAWHDIDGDGIQDPGEAGIEGVIVNLYDQNGVLKYTETTDEVGEYMIDNIYPGNYYLEFIPPPGYQLTISNQGVNENLDSDVDQSNGEGTTQLTYIGSGEVDDSWDAGFYICAKVGDLVWYDTDMDDVWDNIENGINGLRVNLWQDTNNGWELVNWLYTGHKPGTPSDDGFFQFCVSPGTYYLEFEIPPLGLVLARNDIGFDEDRDSDVANFNGPKTTESFTVRSGDSKLDLGAGFYPMASVGDNVWLDENHNGLRDNSEFHMGGVLIQAYNIYNEMIAETISDHEGVYRLDYLQKNSYYLKFHPPDGYSVTTPKRGNDDTMDSDVDHSNGLNTTRYYQMAPGQHTSNVDAGLVYGALPVELLSFKGEQRKTYNYLEWTTVNEINSEYFIVERKHESESGFQVIGRVAAAGTTSGETEYDFNDYDIHRSGIYYYRLKMLDLDGSFKYSHVISIEINRPGRNEVDIFPNPALETATLEISLFKNNHVGARIYTVTGILVKDVIFDEELVEGIYREEINLKGMPPGIYNVQVKIGSENFHKRLIKIQN